MILMCGNPLIGAILIWSLLTISAAWNAAWAGEFLILAGAPAGVIRNNRDLGVAADVIETRTMRLVTAGFNGLGSVPLRDKDLPLSSGDDLRKAVRAAAAQLKPDAGITIIFKGHGTASNNEDLLNGGIQVTPSSNKSSLFLNTILYKEIETILKEELPRSTRIRLVFDSCFSGAVHQISFDLKNVCSASTSDFRTQVYIYPLDKTSPYQRTFWSEFDSAPAGATLSRLHANASENDPVNGERAMLSSEAYVDSVLKTGSYAKTLWSIALDRHPLSTFRMLTSMVGSWPSRSSEALIPDYDCTKATEDARKEQQRIEALAENFQRIARHTVQSSLIAPPYLERASLDGVKVDIRLKLAALAKSLKSAEKIDAFLKVSSEKQRMKYFELLSCESAPL